MIENRKKKPLISKTLITTALFTELKRKANLFDEQVKNKIQRKEDQTCPHCNWLGSNLNNQKNKLEAEEGAKNKLEAAEEPAQEKVCASELEGHGVVANQVQLSDSEAAEVNRPTVENYATDVSLKLENNKGLDNLLQQSTEPVIYNTNASLPIATTSFASKEKDRNSSTVFRTIKSPQSQLTEEQLTKLSKSSCNRHREKCRRLLALLEKYPEHIYWTENGSLYINNKRTKSSVEKYLKALFNRRNEQSTSVPKDINLVLELLCKLKLDYLIVNDTLIKDGKFEWYFLNY